MEFLKNYLNKDTKIIFTSSSAIYGNHNGSISEDTNIKNPESTYGQMKLQSEIYLQNFSNFKNVSTLIIKISKCNRTLFNFTWFNIRYEKKRFYPKKYIQVLEMVINKNHIHILKKF